MPLSDTDHDQPEPTTWLYRVPCLHPECGERAVDRDWLAAQTRMRKHITAEHLIWWLQYEGGTTLPDPLPMDRQPVSSRDGRYVGPWEMVTDADFARAHRLLDLLAQAESLIVDAWAATRDVKPYVPPDHPQAQALFRIYLPAAARLVCGDRSAEALANAQSIWRVIVDTCPLLTLDLEDPITLMH